MKFKKSLAALCVCALLTAPTALWAKNQTQARDDQVFTELLKIIGTIVENKNKPKPIVIQSSPDPEGDWNLLFNSNRAPIQNPLLNRSTALIQGLASSSKRDVFGSDLAGASGALIFPGGKNGVLVARSDDGRWTGPAYVQMNGSYSSRGWVMILTRDQMYRTLRNLRGNGDVRLTPKEGFYLEDGSQLSASDVGRFSVTADFSRNRDDRGRPADVESMLNQWNGNGRYLLKALSNAENRQQNFLFDRPSSRPQLWDNDSDSSGDLSFDDLLDGWR